MHDCTFKVDELPPARELAFKQWVVDSGSGAKVQRDLKDKHVYFLMNPELENSVNKAKGKDRIKICRLIFWKQSCNKDILRVRSKTVF